MPLPILLVPLQPALDRLPSVNGALCGADGDLDIMYGIALGGANKIYENNGDGTFITSTSMITSNGGTDPPRNIPLAVIADFNGEYLCSSDPTSNSRVGGLSAVAY